LDVTHAYVQQQPFDFREGAAFLVKQLPPVFNPPDAAVPVTDSVLHAEGVRLFLYRLPESFFDIFHVVRVDDSLPSYGTARELFGGIACNRFDLGADEGERPVPIPPIDDPRDVVDQGGELPRQVAVSLL